MWAIRILSGPQAGKNFSLKEGDNVIGRSPQSSIVLASNGVSKQHCKILVQDNQVTLVDLGSSNGTFVNGVQVKEKVLISGDKIAFHNIMADIQMDVIPFPHRDSHFQQPQGVSETPAEAAAYKAASNLRELVEKYIEDVVMPSVYRLGEMFELKWLFGCFVLAFIFLVTSLSLIPMVKITNGSIEKESQRRALTIARNLQFINQRLLEQGLTSSLTTQVASKEEGVQSALIIAADTGQILAPAHKAGSYDNEPFLNLARDASKYKSREFVETMGGMKIGASVPMYVFNPEQQSNSIAAYAVVIYDIGSLSIDTGQTISLFVQTLAIAILLGFVLFFFMYKLIEKPTLALNESLDKAMKDGSTVETKFQFPALQNLILNINSLISRVDSSPVGGSAGGYFDKKSEAENLIRIMTDPAIAIDKMQTVIDCNSGFSHLTMISAASVQGQPITALVDQPLILSLQDLMEKAALQPNLIATNSIPMGGTPMEIDTQAISSGSGVEYYIFSIKTMGGRS